MINVFWKYLISKWKTYLASVLMVIIIYTIFYLYRVDVPKEAWQYTIILLILIGTIVTILEFRTYYKIHEKLKFINRHILIAKEEFPKSNDENINIYNNIILKLYKMNYEILLNNDIESSNMIDYYMTWAHQIKTPIAAINFLLEEDELNTRAVKLELFKIECYVDMVLNYLRLGSDTTDYVIESVNLDQVIKDVIKKFAPLFISKSIKLNYVSHETEIISDKKWLSFALEQLISNAIKYTASRGEVSVIVEDSRLTIEDTGIGIHEEDLPRIFDKGFTGFNGRYEKKSSGLGLYLCKKTLDNLGHGIKIQSELNAGTKVSIEFKRKKEFYE